MTRQRVRLKGCRPLRIGGPGGTLTLHGVSIDYGTVWTFDSAVLTASPLRDVSFDIPLTDVSPELLTLLTGDPVPTPSKAPWLIRTGRWLCGMG